MLSCDGTVTNIKVRNVKPQPINTMGLVVDFAERTISFSGHLVSQPKFLDLSGERERNPSRPTGIYGTPLTRVGIVYPSRTILTILHNYISPMKSIC